ncbi:winged helix-turn-helix domain-containing protein [Aliivibrio finisterrensis]|uniref:Winged helix-turn-helix transcriptional regulator n=1 Tax=Aliivibrio finisterrensis TaxID=511998 RepID=A0A6N6RXP4_9GAMM|nr:winged helix-turn-helix domain-containing protein [Aliivibrio finisterrensis]KAB2826385.1 winged helix-turn-helix transcriptional regulator [Aliivibrio finisterrensis]
MIKIKLSKSIYFFPERHLIIINSVENKIEKKQSDLLYFFIRNEKTIFSKHDILNFVWETVVSDQVVSQAIFNLRRVFKENNVKFPIITIHQKGYTYEPSVFDDVERQSTFIHLKSNRYVIFSCLVFLLLISCLNVYFIERNKHEICQIIDCNDLVYLNVNSDGDVDNGILRLLKWHFSASNHVHFSSSNLAKELSSKRLVINFDDGEINYVDDENKRSSFVLKYGNYLNKHDFISLMVRLEEAILIKFRHEEINEMYSCFPDNQESLDLFLSTIGSEYIFSNVNINKLNLAHSIENKNKCIISYRYLLRLFNVYHEYEGSDNLELEINKLNSEFINHMNDFNSEVYNVVAYEAFSAYYLSINKPYKASAFLDRIKFTENTFIGVFLNAKVNDILNRKIIAEAEYLKLSNSISESDFEIMSKSFPQSDLGVIDEIKK